MNSIPEKSVLVKVAVGLPVTGTFVYSVPAELSNLAVPGCRVLVPFGKRNVTGYVLGPGEPIEGTEIKSVIEILDDVPAIPERLLKDLQWLADYYLAPIGEALKGALPAGIEVSSNAGLVIGEQGARILADAATPQSERNALALIAAHPGIPIKRLETLLDVKSGKAIIARIARMGWAIKQQMIKSPSVKPKSEKMIRPIEMDKERRGAEIEKLAKTAPVRARLLSYLLAEGAAPMRDLSKLFKSVPQLVKSLERDGLVEVADVRAWRDPAMGDVIETEPAPPTLTTHQAAAFDSISRALDAKQYAAFLLHGVTGSGKTEVYLRAIARCIEQGRQALLLVPEISLTPQLMGRFRARFGANVAVLHSALGRGERYDEWTRVRNGMVNVAVGARSAVFAPFDNLGVVIVDEEHDGGYKQEDKVRYHARDFAVVRGRSSNAVVILGSATPSLESRRNALDGRYSLLELPCRVRERPMPEVKIVDMRTAELGRSDFFSKELEDAVDANLVLNKQTLLFLNRRGFAPFLMCVECGHTFGCPNCSASATYHLHQKQLRCHLCDWGIRAPDLCPKCSGTKVKAFGAGTQRIEDEVSRLFPEARVARMDRDSVSRKGEMAKILNSLRDGEIDILVGTQMIAKGHDYPNVTLVGALLAETSLNIPDFRAAEITFSLLAQVAGRAGRGEDLGKVIVQTFNPEHYAITSAVHHDYNGFAEHEDALRRDRKYPPYRRLAALKFVGKDAAAVREAAQESGSLARRVKGVEVLGPSPSPWSKIKNEYRWQLVVRSVSYRAAREAVRYAYTSVVDKFSGVKISIDVDPLQLL